MTTKELHVEELKNLAPHKIARRKILGLARNLGMCPCKAENGKERIVWNGKKLSYNDDMTNEEIAHEIAHFLVSPRARRFSAEYGLGTARIYGKAIKAEVSHSVGYREERRAQILGAAISRHFRLDWIHDAIFKSDWKLHNYIDRCEFNPYFADDVEYLIKKGLLNNNVEPVFPVKQSTFNRKQKTNVRS